MERRKVVCLYRRLLQTAKRLPSPNHVSVATHKIKDEFRRAMLFSSSPASPLAATANQTGGGLSRSSVAPTVSKLDRTSPPAQTSSLSYEEMLVLAETYLETLELQVSHLSDLDLNGELVRVLNQRPKVIRKRPAQPQKATRASKLPTPPSSPRLASPSSQWSVPLSPPSPSSPPQPRSFSPPPSSASPSSTSCSSSATVTDSAATAAAASESLPSSSFIDSFFLAQNSRDRGK